MISMSISLLAQSPEKMSYQAVIRNSAGSLVSNSNVGVRIQLLQGSESGAAVYGETHSVTTNENGLATVEIGGGTVVTGAITDIDWSAGPYFLKTETDPTGGTDYSITGVSQILSVPFALHAKTAENGFSGNYNDLTEKPINIDEDKSDDVTLAGDQIVTGNKEFIGIVTVKTPINNTDAVNKDYVDALKNQVEAMNNILLHAGYNGTITDVEGNVYKTVKIGTQIWMAENLKTKKYNDGSAIPNITEDSTWINLTTGAYCWYENNEEAYKNVYGALYNWYATTDDHNLCPTGWHIPTASEWSQLEVYTQEMLKDTSSVWDPPCMEDGEATNSSGFSGLPGGIRVGINPDYFHAFTGQFRFLHSYGFFWLYDDDVFTLTRCSVISIGNELFHSRSKADGYSVRCVKD